MTSNCLPYDSTSIKESPLLVLNLKVDTKLKQLQQIDVITEVVGINRFNRLNVAAAGIRYMDMMRATSTYSPQDNQIGLSSLDVFQVEIN